MSSTAQTDFVWYQDRINAIKFEFRRGMFRMGTAVANSARDRAPYKTGALRNSIRVTTLGSTDDVYVAAGGSVGGKSVPYARIHELGGYAGRNHSVYIQPKHYLANSLDSVLRGDWTQYFKGVA